MTEEGNQDFLDDLFSDGMIQNMMGGCVTVYARAIHRWRLYLKQRMNVADQ